MDEMQELIYPPGTEEMAIKYAAYDIMRQLRAEGKISDAELKYIAEKYQISLDKLKD